MKTTTVLLVLIIGVNMHSGYGLIVCSVLECV